MKSLKKFIDEQILTDETDIQIIKRYFIENNLEEKGMEVSYELAQSKINKINNNRQFIDTWLTTIPSEYLYENYSLEIATNLHNLELEYIANQEIKNKYLIEWAKENIPLIERPNVYFQPCHEYLKSCGIFFKGEK